MRISSLKYRDISNMVQEKQLHLDLFDESCNASECAMRQSCRSKEPSMKFYRVNRPASTRTEATFSTRPTDLKEREFKGQDARMYSNLQSCVLERRKCISAGEKQVIRTGLQYLLEAFTATQCLDEKFKEIDENLAKKCINRLVHLIFYLFYGSYLDHYEPTQAKRKLQSLTFCEYYSREFGFRILTLYICQKIQRVNCQVRNYEVSRTYAIKCLKLALLVRDQNAEIRALQALELLNFYQGKISDFSRKLLGKEERYSLLCNYKEEDEMPDIFCAAVNGRSEIGQKENAVKAWIDNNTGKVASNIRFFEANHHQICKEIRHKNIDIKKMMMKTKSIGEVRKYLRNTVITLRPECQNPTNSNQNQVMLTHRKQTPKDYHRTAQATHRRFLKVLRACCDQFSTN